jgi:hypothetical protein
LHSFLEKCSQRSEIMKLKKKKCLQWSSYVMFFNITWKKRCFRFKCWSITLIWTYSSKIKSWIKKNTMMKKIQYTRFMSRINADISQDSSISFILYLFYNANILKSLKRLRYKIIVIEFVNDINILTYEMSTKNNFRTLKKTHVEYELWARWHKARFASIKYKLMHLTKNHRRFNMTTIININEIIKKSSFRWKC